MKRPPLQLGDSLARQRRSQRPSKLRQQPPLEPALPLWEEQCDASHASAGSPQQCRLALVATGKQWFGVVDGGLLVEVELSIAWELRVSLKVIMTWKVKVSCRKAEV